MIPRLPFKRWQNIFRIVKKAKDLFEVQECFIWSGEKELKWDCIEEFKTLKKARAFKDRQIAKNSDGIIVE